MDIDIQEFMKSVFGNSKYVYFTQEHYDYFENYTLNFVENLNRKLGYNKKFEFLYEDSININGNSFSNDVYDKIIISRGIINKCYAFFFNFLTCFPDLKNFDKENQNLGIKYKFSEKEGLVEYDEDMHIPLDSKQVECADLISEIAVKFCVFHELGHIYNGHLGYLNESEKINNQLSDLQILTLEMDAEAFAIARIIDEILFEEKYYKSYDIYKLVEIISFAVAGILLLVYKCNGNLDLYKKEQLPLGYRIGNALSCIESNMEIAGLLKFVDKNKLKESILSSYRIQRFYSIINNKTMEELVDSIYEGLEDIEENIKLTWKDIRKDLEKYALFKLAP